MKMSGMTAKKPKKLGVLLRLARARRQRADRREDRAVGQVAEREEDHRQHQRRPARRSGRRANCWLSSGSASSAVASQIATWVRPAAPRPRTLPAISGSAGIELSTISTTRFSFSSVTDWSR